MIIAFICVHLQGHTQINLVRNPSFESHWRCPQYIDLVKYANYWTSIVDTNVSPEDTLDYYFCLPEYCNACSDFYKVNVPSNWTYTQYPRTGNGMMQVAMYYNEEYDNYLNKRDYLQGRLKKGLIAGQQYCVSFYVVAEEGSAYAINKIGAYFDDGSIDTTTNCGFPQYTHIPQVYTNDIINDTVHWTKIHGTFTATGNERFITIGNFFDATNTDTQRVHNTLILTNYFLSRYLVDDVSVIKVGTVANAGNDTTIVAGDTIWVGEHVHYVGDSVWHNDDDDYAPVKWYTATGALIDSNHSGLRVHPAVTTKYVMELDVCGVLSYDTVTVQVHGVGVESVERGAGAISVWPNPAGDVVHVALRQAQGDRQEMSYRLVNAMGVVVKSGVVGASPQPSPKEREVACIDLHGLANGVYVLEVTDGSGARVVARLLRSSQ